MKIESLLVTAMNAAAGAGEVINEIYTSNQPQTTYKSDDSPLTVADIKSQEIISEYLQDSGLPMLSEEDTKVPFSTRKYWEYYWLVDPLDGTKEFVKRNGEFSVNIALMQNNSPLAGIIYIPVKRIVYWSVPGDGVYKLQIKELNNFRIKNLTQLKKQASRLPFEKKRKNIIVVTSRSFKSAETEQYILMLKEKHPDTRLIATGSAVKFGLIAEGTADVYPRFAPTMEWDVAAGHALLNELGYSVTSVLTGQSLFYNKPDLSNPWFIAKNNRL